MCMFRDADVLLVEPGGVERIVGSGNDRAGCYGDKDHLVYLTPFVYRNHPDVIHQKSL